VGFIGLVVFLAIAYFALRFAFAMLAHLFRVFGWLTVDITKTVTKTLDIDIDAGVARKAESDSDAEPPAAEEVFAPRRATLRSDGADDGVIYADAEKLRGTPRPIQWPKPKQQEQEISLLQMIGIVAVEFAAFLMNFIFGAIDFIHRIPDAFRQPYPLRASVWYGEYFLCILPLVVFFRVPDVYGLGPVIRAILWGLSGYAGFIFLIYFLRVLIPVDLETVFQRDGKAVEDAGGFGTAGVRHLLYGLLILAVSVFVLIKLIFLGFFILGFFYSFLYFFAFRKRGDPRFTLNRFIVSWIIFGVFAGIAVGVLYYDDLINNGAGLALSVVIFVSLLFVQMLWVMSRKYEVRSGFRELPIRRVGSWLNMFFSPLAKLALGAPLFYFILLFVSVNEIIFSVVVLVILLAALARRRFSAMLPVWMPRGAFACYICLVWFSIFYVHSYNRIPPSEAACSAISSSGGELKQVWTMAQYGREPFLSGTLPYDAIYDPASDAVFVSFKNLSGRGAVVRVNESDGRMAAHLIAESDRRKNEMFYPERFCIDRSKKLLYATTKSDKNFQLLEMDYGSGLKLAGRIKFPRFETTNCEVDEKTGDIYVIFLGPPDNHIRVIDGTTHKEVGALRFGRLGYADYFAMDLSQDRLVVPSLDVLNRFRVYDVSGLKKRAYRPLTRRVALDFRLPGGTASVPIPTLGIAQDRLHNRYYFTCPFIRLVLEVDGKTFRIRRYYIAGRFPREIAVNERRGLLLVANYGSGTVDAIDLKSWKVYKRFTVGKLVRSLYVDEETGKNFAVSACGVYEIDAFPEQ